MMTLTMRTMPGLGVTSWLSAFPAGIFRLAKYSLPFVGFEIAAESDSPKCLQRFGINTTSRILDQLQAFSA